MKSRTSFFNRTLLRKNITRFAPLWGIYLLCLLMGLGLMYMESDRRVVNFWFASYMAQCIQVMGVVNLFYAPVTAMLLFGDLFNSRMCNAIHAMPLRRETIFATNVVSGLLFSLIPTAVMGLLSVPLLMGTVVRGAWKIAALWFVGANLEFTCFFGMAVFCVFCAGNRLGFTALYAVINGGPYLVWALADMLYTPMLYGVVTPSRLVKKLTPIAQMVDDTFVEVENYNDLRILFDGREKDMVAAFWVDGNYVNLFLFALVGLAFMALGLVLYRRRQLECAGDAVAVRALAPVFQIAAAVAGGAAAVLFLEMFFSYRLRTDSVVIYGMAVCGMVVGWFAGKMLLERSTRVFRLRNWIGLGAMVTVFLVSLTLTHYDIFGIETRLPRVEKVSSVTLNANGEITLTEKSDIEQILRLQEMALEDRLEASGMYPASYVESVGRSHITMPEEGFTYGEEGVYDEMEHHYYADLISITYTMENGRQIQRRYTIWASFEEGEIIREYASRWETVWKNARAGYRDEIDLERIIEVSVDGQRFPEELKTQKKIQELMDAIRADCDERTMYQDTYYHNGRFVIPVENEYDDRDFYYDSSLYLDITTYTHKGKDLTGMYLRIFPDSRHTLRWLRDNGMMPYEVIAENVVR